MNKPDYISTPDWNILINKYSEKELKQYIDKDYPYQYLIGDVQFYNSKIIVNKNVLIPRWETEELVNRVIKKLANFNPKKGLDICTGSGCIAISLSNALNIPFNAIDISRKAWKVAKKNVVFNHANVKLIQKDILKKTINDKYDLIICNPPYVSYEEEVGKETKYEPQNALFADNRGLLFYQVLLKQLNNNVLEKYFIAFEIGASQKKDVINIAKRYFSNSKITVEKDLNNKDRYLFITNIE